MFLPIIASFLGFTLPGSFDLRFRINFCERRKLSGAMLTRRFFSGGYESGLPKNFREKELECEQNLAGFSKVRRYISRGIYGDLV